MSDYFAKVANVEVRTKLLVVVIVLFVVYTISENSTSTSPVASSAMKGTTNSSASTVSKTETLAAPPTAIPLKSSNTDNNEARPPSLLSNVRPIQEPLPIDNVSTAATSAQLIPASALDHDASFDCHKAKGALETLICSDSALSSIDKKMGELYSEVRLSHSKHGINNSDALEEQREFLKIRTEACSIPLKLNAADSDKENATTCLKEIYALRIKTLSEESSQLDNTTIAPVTAPTTASADPTPLYIPQPNSTNYNACVNGWSYTCNRQILTPEQLAVVNEADSKRNLNSCLNGWSYSCNRQLLTPEQLSEVDRNDLQRNYNACVNGWDATCNKHLLTADQLTLVNNAAVKRNLNACLNGWSFNCNRSLLTEEQLTEVNKNDQQRNYYACSHGLSYACNVQMLAPK